MSGFVFHDLWSRIIGEAEKSTSIHKLASAYISLSGIKRFPLRTGSMIVVDASERAIMSGSTDVKALRYLFKNECHVFSVENLHAKVFLFENIAFVGSTNISRSSQHTLIEASYITDKKKDLLEIERFINALCQDKLDAKRIEELGKIPVINNNPPNVLVSKKYKKLIMQLTGESRGTQVQPPVPIWKYYFGINVDQKEFPALYLSDINSESIYNFRNVVRHDHTLTIEIPGSDVKRPALIEFNKEKENHYKYRIIGKDHEDFATLSIALENIKNPLRTHGRLWLVF